MSFSLYPVAAGHPEKSTSGQGPGRPPESPQAPCASPTKGDGPKPLLGKEELLMGGLIYLSATARGLPRPGGRQPTGIQERLAAQVTPHPPRRLESRPAGSAPVRCQMNGGTRAA